MNQSPSDEELIKSLKRFKKEIGKTPTTREMEQKGPYSRSIYSSRFGSWNDALKAAGMQPVQATERNPSRKDLIEDLKRINESVFSTPKREDIEKYADYGIQHYQREFDSLVIALQEAGIEPTEKQYRFSKLPTPEEKRGSQIIQVLRRNGPTTWSELPGDVSPKDKGRGVTKFNIKSGKGASDSTGGKVDSIYYLRDIHSPKLVLKRFFEENPRLVSRKSKHGLKLAIRKHDTSWTDVGYELVDELTSSGFSSEGAFQKLLVINCWGDEYGDLRYCFDQTVDCPPVVDEEVLDDTRIGPDEPIWGLPEEEKSIWESLSPGDGVLFSIEPEIYNRSFTISKKIQDYTLSKDLWVEYEDGVRVGGLDQLWPYLIVGETIYSVTVSEDNLRERFGWEVGDRTVEMFDSPNSYDSFEAFIKNQK